MECTYTYNAEILQYNVLAKAKAANVPNENIERIIKKAAGEGDTNNYEELLYEGYGPSGVAVVVETLTDNRNRTAGEMRHYFDKCGGNLGQSGSVTFMFERKGIIVIEGEGLDEDTVMEDALEAGADDFTFDGDVFEICTDANSLGTVRDALEEKGYTFVSAEVEYVPSTTTASRKTVVLPLEGGPAINIPLPSNADTTRSAEPFISLAIRMFIEETSRRPPEKTVPQTPALCACCIIIKPCLISSS